MDALKMLCQLTNFDHSERPLRTAGTTVVPAAGDIRVWTGAIRDEQWMKSAVLMRGFGEVVRPEVKWWVYDVNR